MLARCEVICFGIPVFVLHLALKMYQIDGERTVAFPYRDRGLMLGSNHFARKQRGELPNDSRVNGVAYGQSGQR